MLLAVVDEAAESLVVVDEAADLLGGAVEAVLWEAYSKHHSANTG